MRYLLKNKEIELSDEEVSEIVKQNNKKEEKVVGIAIKNRFTGEIMFQSSKTTHKEAVAEKGDADLSCAELSCADLRGADLRDADLRDANLRGANLYDADLCGANLRGANLCGANLRGANLRGAELDSAKFYGRGGTKRLTKAQLPDFLSALGFQIED